MSAKVWLNVDLGELPDEPEELYSYAHIANVACGGHAGDPASMQRSLDRCARHGVMLGAHPSYPDREGFGRRRVQMPPRALRASLADQCTHLGDMARARGQSVLFVKAHGALYHAAREDAAVAEALVDVALAVLGAGVTVIGPPSGALIEAAARGAIAFAREGFADRQTREDGTLVSRDEPGALVHEPSRAAARAAAMVARGDVETVCVHGDTPGAVAVARAVRAALDARRGA